VLSIEYVQGSAACPGRQSQTVCVLAAVLLCARAEAADDEPAQQHETSRAAVTPTTRGTLAAFATERDMQPGCISHIIALDA
jgi:hypothetical protein